MEVSEAIDELRKIMTMRRRAEAEWIQEGLAHLAKTPRKQADACEFAIEHLKILQDDGK